MAIQTLPGARSVVVGLLVLVLVVAGALPASAGSPGSPGSPSKPKPAGSHSSGGHTGGTVAQQSSGATAPAARKSQGGAPGPAHRSTAAPRPPKQAAGPPKQAASPAPPASRTTPGPGERKPEPKGDPQGPDRKADVEGQGPRPSPASRPRGEVRSSTASRTERSAERPDRPRMVRSPVRSTATVMASSADTAASPSAPTPVVRLQAAALQIEPRRLWPALPGPAGHPAFPVLLAAVLVGFVVLGFRGDRRDPKLAAAAIDDRDDRAVFR